MARRLVVYAGAFALLIPFVFVKCSETSGAKSAVRSALLDGDSAQFGDFARETHHEVEFGCFTVNARNTVGTYTGDQQAFLVKLNDQWEVISISAETQAKCLAAGRVIAEKMRGKAVDKAADQIPRL